MARKKLDDVEIRRWANRIEDLYLDGKHDEAEKEGRKFADAIDPKWEENPDFHKWMKDPSHRW